MNSNSIAKLYDRLSPRERLPLIVAAYCRKDEAEQGRLAQSAPRISYGVPDYYGLAEGVFAMTNFHLLKMLDLVALFWQSMTGIVSDRAKNAERLLSSQYLVSYLLLARAEGWRLICEKYGIDGNGLLATLPGADTVQQLVQRLSAAVTQEQIAKHLRELPGNETLELRTPAEVAAEYRSAVELHRNTWKKCKGLS